VDMLRDFLEPEGALFCGPQARAIIPTIQELRDRLRRRGALVIFACDRHDPDDVEFQRFPPHCLRGTPGGEVIPELTPREGELVVEKRRFSALFDTPLEEILQRVGVKVVHLAGVCTSICVMETASDLRERDYQVVVHRRAVADLDPEDHRWALRRMERVLGATVI